MLWLLLIGLGGWLLLSSGEAEAEPQGVTVQPGRSYRYTLDLKPPMWDLTALQALRKSLEAEGATNLTLQQRDDATRIAYTMRAVTEVTLRPGRVLFKLGNITASVVSVEPV